jgi:hypothetical protein
MGASGSMQNTLVKRKKCIAQYSSANWLFGLEVTLANFVGKFKVFT